MLARQWRMNMKLARFCTGKILAVVAVAVVAGALAPQAVATQVMGKFERSLTVTGPANLNVTTGAGDIAVTTSDSDKVIVRGTVHAFYESSGDKEDAQDILSKIQANPPVEQHGNTISVGHEAGSLYEHVIIDYELVVPRQSDFLAQTGSGDLSIIGPLKSVDVKTGSGDARIESVQGSVQLTTGSGDVTVTEAGSRGATVRTGSGDVAVSLPSEVGLNLSVQTGSGDISMDRGMPIESVNTNHHQLSAKVRGGGAAFVVQTGSGDVRIH
jgi:DUF4097 and DUF4098 domain-containing protein YvlB